MTLNAVKGKLRPIRDHVLVTDMEFDAEVTSSGIYIPSQNGKSGGIKPRWGRVYAIGPEQKDISVGDWVYVDHGRWTRGITVIDENDNEIIIRRVDNKDVLLTADEKPKDIYFNDL